MMLPSLSINVPSFHSFLDEVQAIRCFFFEWIGYRISPTEVIDTLYAAGGGIPDMWNQPSWRGLALLLSILFLASCARTTPLSKEDLAAALRDNPEVLLEALEREQRRLGRNCREGVQGTSGERPQG
jgi:hypothetical protein